MAEILDIVDENGTPTGQTVDRETAHLKGIPHRTAHVWLAWVLYYAASLCFGATYNMLFLAYLALFVCTLYGFITGIYGISKEDFGVPDILAGKACTIFLLLSGISTFIAWLPDIIESFGKGTLGLII